MASLDIGIDLGTSTIIASNSNRGTVIKEPSVVAINAKSGEVISIGSKVYDMIGRTPDHIQVVRPLADGVISNFALTGVMIQHMMRRICHNQLLKPQVIVCVPSAITHVEAQAVVDATKEAGARKVHLIEEPVAAALGAGLDLSRPNGNLIVDIGGGTTDVAVLSLNGIVQKSSARTAGQRFDEAIIRYMRTSYNMLVGDKTAESVKIEIGSVSDPDEEVLVDVKGRDLITGLPKKQPVSRKELYPVLCETADGIVLTVRSVLERTPPELIGDIRTNGIIMTGGGALLHGLDEYLTQWIKAPAKVSANAVECVAIGTAKSFSQLGKLYDGFLNIK